MNEEISHFSRKSQHAIKVSEDLLAKGYSSDAMSKIYYAMFYASQALLKSARIDVVKRSAVESAIGYHFVKTGRIDVKYHRVLIDARKLREVADYDLQETILRTQTTDKIAEAKMYLKVVKKIILKVD